MHDGLPADFSVVACEFLRQHMGIAELVEGNLTYSVSRLKPLGYYL